ncbi:acyltransferase family protein [Enterococcus sp. DIV0876]|uniref:acyltransferase family protein n=1 Tax=Enterococcus sp. DIV0876 TaxID=2774633 RepID=UPI003D2FBB67
MKQKYPLVDYGQLVAALLVVLIHCGRLAENEVVHFVIKSMICRMAVPFFLMLNGYFYQTGAHAFRKWWCKQRSVYLFWTLLYAPIGILYVQQMQYLKGLPVWVYPFILIIAYMTIGVFYHLWYFPALMMGMWLVRGTQRFGYRIQFGIASILYMIGSVETYSAYLPAPIAAIYQQYRHLFLTTRNGLFYSFLFILCGFFLAEGKQIVFTKRNHYLLLCLSVMSVCIEGVVVYQNQGDDKNFLFSLVPIVFLITAFVTRRTTQHAFASAAWARKFSRWCFFVHPLILELGKWAYGWSGFQLFGWTIGGVCLSYILKSMCGHSRRISYIKTFFTQHVQDL